MGKNIDSQTKRKVSKLDMVALGIGDLGYSIISCTVATYIVSFGTMALPGVAASFATLMGIAVGIAVIFDAISDPIMGYISDHFNSKIFGKRHLFMLVGLIGMMACAIAIWYVPFKTASTAGIFIWFTVFLILIRTFNTMYYTPVGAFSVEISNDYNERTTIQLVRSIFYVVGMLLPVILMGSFQNKYAGIYDQSGFELIAQGKDAIKALTAFDPTLVFNGMKESEALSKISELGYTFRKGQQVANGYRNFALLGTGICVACSAFLLLVTRKYVKILRVKEENEAKEKGIDLNAPKQKFNYNQVKKMLEEENPGTIFTKKEIKAKLNQLRLEHGQITLGSVMRNFFSAFKVKEMRVLAIGYTVAMMTATLIISLGFNVFTFTFKLETTQMYVLMGGLLLMTIGCQPVWGKLAKKKTKQASLLIGLTISLVGCVLLFIEFLLRKQINSILELGGAASWGGSLILLPPLMIAGMGTGVLYSMPLALVGDIVSIQEYEGKGNKTGTYAGVMTFCYKAGQGIVTSISSFLLTTVGFVSGAASQTEEASDGIGWILMVGIVIFMGFGLLILSRLKIDKNKVNLALEKSEQMLEVDALNLSELDTNSDGEEETTIDNADKVTATNESEE